MHICVNAYMCVCMLQNRKFIYVCDQDFLRESGGLAIVLSNCFTDFDNPFGTSFNKAYKLYVCVCMYDNMYDKCFYRIPVPLIVYLAPTQNCRIN